MAKRGRPSVYTPEIAEKICERLSQGESLKSICRDEEMPADSTVRQWAIDDHEGFSAHYARARDGYLDHMADETLVISDDSEGDVARDRLRVDTRKWYLSKLAPKRYGDRLVNAYEGADGNPADPPGSLSDLELGKRLAFLLDKAVRAG